MTKKHWVALSVFAANLLLVATILAQGAPTIVWSAIAAGGGSATAGGVTLDSVIGQWTASVGPQISSGFLPGAASASAVRQLRYLPLVLKQ
jgi:hypothetical protein